MSQRVSSRSGLLALVAITLLLALATRPAWAQFTEIDPGLPQPPFPCVAWGDYDNDGDLDVLVAGLGSHDIAFSTLFKNTGGVFASSGIALLGLSRASAAWGDFDGDGDLDLAMTGLTTAGVPTTAVFRNDGATFTTMAGPFLGVLGGSVAWGDYDNDGDLDLLVTGVTSTVPSVGVAATRLYRNDGGTFTDIGAGLLGVLWASATWGDFDNDGDLDAMIIGYDAGAAVPKSILYRNDAGTFTDTGTPFHAFYLGTASAADYDNDRDLDLPLAGNGGGFDLLRVYRNDTATPNTAPTAPATLTSNPLGTSVDLSWSAGSDDHTPAAGLGYNLRIGTTPGGAQIVSPHSAANGYRRVPALGNVQCDRSARIDHLQLGTTYYWSVQSIDGALVGSPFAAERSFTMAPAGVADPASAVALDLRAAPNPFRGGTTLRMRGAAGTRAEVAIFDPAGRRVRTVWTGILDGRETTLTWDGRDGSGRDVGAGIYLARVESAARAPVATPAIVVKLR